jgi:hypothetical protein
MRSSRNSDGFLLKFIQGRHPDIRLQGVDAARNLIAIASELCGSSFMSGDYREVQPDQKYDLIVCDLGFDLARFTESSTPHTTASVGDFQYSPGCSNDLKRYHSRFRGEARVRPRSNQMNWNGPMYKHQPSCSEPDVLSLIFNDVFVL